MSNMDSVAIPRLQTREILTILISLYEWRGSVLFEDAVTISWSIHFD